MYSIPSHKNISIYTCFNIKYLWKDLKKLITIITVFVFVEKAQMPEDLEWNDRF